MLRARHPAVEHVADDGDRLALQRPQRSRRVKASSSACEGCSCVPSPALTTAAAHVAGDQVRGPGAGCRMTMTLSAPIASMFRTVSSSVSPLETLEASRRPVEHVRAERLGRDLERGAGCGWCPRRRGWPPPCPQRAQRRPLRRPRCGARARPKSSLDVVRAACPRWSAGARRERFHGRRVASFEVWNFSVQYCSSGLSFTVRP